MSDEQALREALDSMPAVEDAAQAEVAAGRKCKTIISKCAGFKFLKICVKIDVCY